MFDIHVPLAKISLVLREAAERCSTNPEPLPTIVEEDEEPLLV
jgi:hypothetical protein